MEVKKKVLVIDDHPIVRHGLKQLVEADPALAVCGEAGNAHDAFELLNTIAPDLILVDISLNGVSGLDLLKELRDRNDKVPVMIVSMYTDAIYLRQALEIGAQGYIDKKEAIRNLSYAIHRVLGGHVYLSERMMDQLAQMVNPEQQKGEVRMISDLIDEMTTREREILEYVGKGFRPQQIAHELNLSVRTVHSHRQNLRKKLNLDSAADLDQFAINWVHSRPDLDQHHG